METSQKQISLFTEENLTSYQEAIHAKGIVLLDWGGGENSHWFMWPHFIRVVKETQPFIAVNENVHGQISNNVLKRKISDFESQGYRVWPPIVISGHYTEGLSERKRVFLIADSIERRLEGWEFSQKERQWKNKRRSVSTLVEVKNREISPQPRFYRTDDGVSERLDGITFSKWRKESLMAYGNAVDPFTAYEILQTIEQIIPVL